jgi:hypothetical protein
MRTTLNIEDDVLQAAKELAQREGSTAGRVLSALARHGLRSQAPVAEGQPTTRGGVPLLASRGEIVTLDRVRGLMDEEGVAG